MAQVPFNLISFELGINLWQNTKIAWFNSKRRIFVYWHYYGVQTITCRGNFPFCNVEFGSDFISYHDFVKNYWEFSTVWLLVLSMSWICASGFHSWMGYFTAFNDEGYCAPSVFEVPVTHHNCCTRLDWPDNVYLYSLGGMVLRIPCLRDRGCGMVLEVMNNACAFYDVLGDIFLNSRVDVLWKVGVYITINFSEPPTDWSTLSFDYRDVWLSYWLGMFQESVMMFGIHLNCGVCAIIPGSKFEWGG